MMKKLIILIFLFVLASIGLGAELLDDFADGDANAETGWGTWGSYSGGDRTTNTCSVTYTATGYADNGAGLTYYLGSGGSWGVAHIAIDFGSAHDMDGEGYTNIAFMLKGNGTGDVMLVLNSVNSGDTNSYGNYKYNCGSIPTEWTSYYISFNDFVWSGGTQNFTLEEAIASCQGFKWEMDDESSSGSFIIDNIYLNSLVTVVYETNELQTEDDIAVEIHNNVLDISAGESVSRIFARHDADETMDIAVYTIDGRLVRQLNVTELDSEVSYADWDGYTEDGVLTGAGIYYAVCKNKDTGKIKIDKIMVVR